ncbi:MAG: DUF2868 domain-containing protein [Gammaproteobacteria bacterium]|nr:DUF2868 domain-containing protein [Gammaproteobacteria bacterium]MBK9467101.1 DUF2868 domain-containing protein [Gammaproteobacteria bacterium]MBP6479607.1 DUF2868 domain-containing protein [Pseudomonadales bacterium]MBP7908564.1 DUF2868 domain-containing protein [Pseudomonadales bacterium]
MTEHDALKVLLVRSIETQGGFGNQLQDADKQMATRMAIEQVGKDAAPDAFIAARATALIGQLAPKEPLIEAILAVRLWRSAWIWASVAVGLVLGVGTSELFGEDDRQNIVDLLPWLVILWNLAVYVALIAGKHMPLRPGFIERLARWANPWSLAAMTGKRHGSPAFLFHPRLRPLIRRIRSSTELAAVLRDFGRAWTSACLPMVTARTALLLHAASFAFVIGVIVSMYANAWGNDLALVWESSIVTSPGAARLLLSVLFAPALYVTGFALPDTSWFAALRESAGSVSTVEAAMDWLYLYVVSLLLLVAIPRMLLALWNVWRSRRLSCRFPLSLDDGYFRSLLRAQRDVTANVRIVPYACEPAEAATDSLEGLVGAAIGGPAVVNVETPVPFGGEDEPALLPAPHADTTHLLVLFDLGATPEEENHGAFIKTIEDRSALRAVLVVNESGFIRRFGANSSRHLARREAWATFASSLGRVPLFVSLDARPSSDAVRELRSLVYTSGGA